MGIEIERKFLLRDDSWRDAVTTSRYMVQGYLASDPACSVRVRIADADAWLNIKGATADVSREEFEYSIPLADAQRIVESLCRRPIIAKRRHIVPVAGYTFEIDEFEAENAGLIVAEVELPSADAEFPRPAWLGEEVSSDARYFNASLARRPFKTW